MTKNDAHNAWFCFNDSNQSLNQTRECLVLKMMVAVWESMWLAGYGLQMILPTKKRKLQDQGCSSHGKE